MAIIFKILSLLICCIILQNSRHRTFKPQDKGNWKEIQESYKLKTDCNTEKRKGLGAHPGSWEGEAARYKESTQCQQLQAETLN